MDIKAWGLENAMIAFVFDTTAINTGKVRDAIVRSHHVCELIAKAYCIFVADLGHDWKFFVEIKEDNIDNCSKAEFQT